MEQPNIGLSLKQVVFWLGKQLVALMLLQFIFQGDKQAGTLFSKGHYVSGVPRTEAMERGFNIGKSRLAEEAAKIIEKELNYVS